MRWRGTTTQRGYGATHQQQRRNALKAWRPGDRCPRCGQLLDGNPANMDLGHIDGTSKQLYAGLEHRACNRAAGARLRNIRQRQTRITQAPCRPLPWQPSRNW